MNKPVTILTGFLGSGKTTFLNHLLNKNNNIKYAIIENEFGEKGVDNELVLRPDETIVELNNGCLCCTLNDNLYDILNELHERRDKFDEIIIEATGVADPRGLAAPFISHPLIREHFPITAIICLVDAELIEDQLKETEEAINQITFSDILLINKTDLVNDNYLNQLERKLKRLNPLAELHKGSKDNYPEISFENENEILEKLLKTNKPATDEDNLSFPVHKPHHHHHHTHTEDINSETFILDKPFDYEKLYQQLFIYLTFQAKNLYRMKGLVWIEGKEKQFLIQSVGVRLDVQEKRLWMEEERKQSTIVFIGKNLQRKGLEKLLFKCLANTLKKEESLAK